MSSVRFLASPNTVLRHFSGRTYKANSLGIVDVLASDAAGIHAQGTPLFEIGTTAQRPGPMPERCPNWWGIAITISRCRQWSFGPARAGSTRTATPYDPRIAS
jgi:hypothetical protein